MNLISRYQPALAWVDELDRLFDRTIRSFTHAPQSRETVHESDKAWILRLDLPGFRKDDLMIRVTEGKLHLVGETPKDRAFGGNVERQWKLGPEIDETAIEAKLENGVLELLFPKKAAEAIEPRTIHIN
jgi:HSP20 family protein